MLFTDDRHVAAGAKKFQRGTTDLDQLPAWSALVIGSFQAIAILPGISRAGSTVAAGLVCGLKRPDAARFSFFIAIPAIGGATLLELIKILRGKVVVDVAWQPMMLGAMISFVVGVLCLRWLIRLLVADRLHWFAIYCLIVGWSDDCVAIRWSSSLTSDRMVCPKAAPAMARNPAAIETTVGHCNRLAAEYFDPRSVYRSTTGHDDRRWDSPVNP